MRMQPKPKSAPARFKSKYMSSKSSAMKEVEAWMKKDSDSINVVPEASRMSGQLVDNVTEERMLKSKLWELSKERYKFLSQSAYEKKVFVDRMQRKSSAIRKVLLQNEYQGSRRQSLDYSESNVSSKSSKTSNARFAFLDRMDPTKSRDRPKGLRGLNEVSKAKSVSFVPSLEVKPFHTFKRDIETPDLKGTKASGPKLPYVVLPTESQEETTEDTGRSWAYKKSAKKLSAVDRMLQDPRYMHLEHMLTPVHYYKTANDVQEIVNSRDCLHVPPKRPKESKPKIGIKALEFMRERGFVI